MEFAKKPEEQKSELPGDPRAAAVQASRGAMKAWGVGVLHGAECNGSCFTPTLQISLNSSNYGNLF